MNTQLSVFTFAKKLGNSISRVEPVEQEIEGLRLSNYEFQRIQDALAPIKNEDGSIKAINARELHEWLEIGRDFSNWIKDQIERADLTEKLDYEVVEIQSGSSSGGRPRKEYHLSPDAAKRLLMASEGPNSKKIRHYFLDCEKRLRHTRPKTYADELRELASDVEAKERHSTYIQALEENLAAEKKRIAENPFAGISGILKSEQDPPLPVSTYFILNNQTNQIKIGKSTDPQSRIRSIKTMAGVELEVLYIHDQNIESLCHQKFEHIRGIGEWFEFTDELAQFVLDLMDEKFKF